MKYEFASDEELKRFIADNLVGTNEAMDILDCSRQNIAGLISRGKLTPIVVLQRDRLFWKADIEARKKPSE